MRVVIAITLGLALAGCGGAQVPAAEKSAPETVASSTTGPVPTSSVTAPATPDALKFTSTTLDGQPFDGATLTGKPVVLWFWTAWCTKCRAKAPDVAGLQRDNAGKVSVVGVAGLSSGDAAMRKFVSDTAITGFPHLADDNGVVWRKFGVTTQEYFVLIGKDGQIIHKGPLTTADLRQRIAAMAG